jgi:hydroxymethylpyrimidine/phosphomethylpyrimidine kinase
MMRASLPCALTIAGSDPSGGAGVEADLKTFSALEVYGACVITAVTVQDTSRVYDTFPLPSDLVKRQLEVVLDDLPVKAVKTGMLHNGRTMKAVGDALRLRNIPLVVDPVFRAGSGDPLIKESAKEILFNEIFPRALIVTPNLAEAEDIHGSRVASLDDMIESAKTVAKYGSKFVLIKGGTFKEGKIIDLLYHDGRYRTFEKERISVNAHGAGCTLSSAITAFLAHGLSLDESIAKAETFMDGALRFSLLLGRGRRPVHQMVHLYNEAQRWEVATTVGEAAKRIVKNPYFRSYIAEVGTQIAMALPYAHSKNQIAAINGRIRKVGRTVKMGEVKFGVSTHMANVVLTVMKRFSEIKSAMNLRYDEKLVDAFRSLGMTISSFNRQKEPKHIKEVEGKSLIWGTEEAMKRINVPPDVIFDLGGDGKEPMIRVLGKSADEVVEKALTAIRSLPRGSSGKRNRAN